jgi:hypothetical protein
MPAIGGLTGAQAHLRGFAFWNSHKIRIIDFLIFQSQFVQSAPRRIAGRLRGIGGRLRKACWTDLASTGITSGMGWQSEMYIFSYLRGQVNQLPSVKLLLKGERLDDQLGLKVVQADHAAQADAETQTSCGKDPTAGNTNIQGITNGRNRERPSFFQLQKPGILGALKMKCAALRNLAQMNLHTKTLNVNAGTFNAQV